MAIESTLRGAGAPGPDADKKLFPPSPQQQVDEADLEKLVDFYRDLSAQNFSRSTAYSNVIMGAGYVGAFGLWNVIREQLSTFASNLIVLSIGLSLLGFISWQVFNMIWNTIDARSFDTKTKGKVGVEYIKAYKAAQRASQRRYRQTYRPLWERQLVFCIVTAAIGVGTLLVNAAFNLLR